MACTRPLNAYQMPSGKIFFTPSRGAKFIQLPAVSASVAVLLILVTGRPVAFMKPTCTITIVLSL